MQGASRSIRREIRWSLVVAVVLGVVALAAGPPPRAAETAEGGAEMADAPPLDAGEARIDAGPAGMNIELHAQEEDLSTVLEMLSRQAEVNIVASSKVSGKVTADLYDVSVEEVLQAVSRANNLRWVREGEFIYIHTPEEMKEIRESEERLETRIFQLNYLTSEEARKLVAPAMSEKGTLAETSPSETGIPASSANVGGDNYSLPDTLVVRDFPENLEQVAAILKRMDRRPRQVLVEATVLQVTLNDETDLGVNFNALAGMDFRDLSTTVHPVTNPNSVPNADGTTVDTQTQTRFGHVFARGFASVGDGLNIGVMTNSVSIFLNALEEVKDTTILSNPKVLALNKQPAEVNVGDQIGYRGDVTSTETTEVSEAEFLDVGTVLRFRPFISDDGYVRLEVHPEVSQRGQETIDGVPSKRTTQVTCNAMIRDGHTLVIGGLFDETVDIDRSQIPGLGNLPGAGFLFRNKTDSTVRNEIIILLTPHIIDHEDANRLGEELRDDAKRRAIGMREGFHFFTRERLTVRYVQQADEAYRNYLRTGAGTDLNRAWWYTQLALNVAPGNLHALTLKDRILTAKNRGPRPPRSWTIWDKISEDIKPNYRADDRPQDSKATAEEGRRPKPEPIGARPLPEPVMEPPPEEAAPGMSRAEFSSPEEGAAEPAATAVAAEDAAPAPTVDADEGTLEMQQHDEDAVEPLHVRLGPAPLSEDVAKEAEAAVSEADDEQTDSVAEQPAPSPEETAEAPAEKSADQAAEGPVDGAADETPEQAAEEADPSQEEVEVGRAVEPTAPEADPGTIAAVEQTDEKQEESP